MLGATPLLMRFRRASVLQGMLQGIMAGAFGLMGATAILIGRAAITNLWQALLAGNCVVLLIRWKVSPISVIVGVAALGVLQLLLPLP